MNKTATKALTDLIARNGEQAPIVRKATYLQNLVNKFDIEDTTSQNGKPPLFKIAESAVGGIPLSLDKEVLQVVRLTEVEGGQPVIKKIYIKP